MVRLRFFVKGFYLSFSINLKAPAPDNGPAELFWPTKCRPLSLSLNIYPAFLSAYAALCRPTAEQENCLPCILVSLYPCILVSLYPRVPVSIPNLNCSPFFLLSFYFFISSNHILPLQNFVKLSVSDKTKKFPLYPVSCILHPASLKKLSGKHTHAQETSRPPL